MQKDKVIGLLFISLGLAQFLSSYLAVSTPYTYSDENKSFSILFPGKYALVVSARFSVVNQPASSGVVVLTHQETGRTINHTYHMFSTTRQMETLEGGKVLWLEAGIWKISVVMTSGDATILVRHTWLFNFLDPGRSSELGYMLLAIVMCIALCFLGKKFIHFPETTYAYTRAGGTALGNPLLHGQVTLLVIQHFSVLRGMREPGSSFKDAVQAIIPKLASQLEITVKPRDGTRLIRNTIEELILKGILEMNGDLISMAPV